QVRTAAYHLIEKKGATYHAIGLATLYVIESIARDQNSVLTVSSLLQGYKGIADVAISVPSILNRSGISAHIDLPLNEKEQAGLRRSAEVIQAAIRAAGL
ncbi:MAG TPA: L-lactate dehydrogenase, partial [bacterium]|nr:L-lactate dehydrogenase [bacterium]